MDGIYTQSNVLLALKDTLQDLTAENFITRAIADAIFGICCKALRRNITQQPSTHATITLQGHLLLYRFRKNIWTLYVDSGRLDLLLPEIPGATASPPSCRISLERPLKIIAADKRLWDSKR